MNACFLYYYKIYAPPLRSYIFYSPPTQQFMPILGICGQVPELCGALGFDPPGPLLCSGRRSTKQNCIATTGKGPVYSGALVGLLRRLSRPTQAPK